MKKIYILILVVIVCMLAGCKREENTQTSEPPASSEQALSQATSAPDGQQTETQPPESIAPVLDLFDAEYILDNSEFANLDAESVEISDEDTASLVKMVATLRVTNDALVELDKLEAEDPEYLMNAKAPITALMSGIKDAHEEGMTLEHSDELEGFHRLYMSVLILNYNGADLMTQAMDGNDTTLAAEAYELFDKSEQQYSLLIDYANLLLGHPLPTGSASPTPTE